MRLFLAVEVDETLKNQLDYLSHNIRRYTKKGRFTDRDNAHLTIRFLGEVHTDSVDKLIRAIDGTAKQVDPFILYLDSLGSFPKKQKHVLWVGVGGQTDKLVNLHDIMESELEKIGYQKEERPFNPHITIGRQIELIETLDDIRSKICINKTQLDVNHLSLMESTRVEGKLVYRPIYQRSFNSI